MKNLSKINFKDTLEQLVNKYGTLYQVSKELGINYNTLYSLLNGINKYPRWDIGVKILEGAK